MNEGWAEISRPGRSSMRIDGVEVGRGSRVVLRPRDGGDIWGATLANRIAVVESVEEEIEGKVQVVVTVEDDPGRDFGLERHPGHRFFFSPDEIEPLAGSAPRRKVLVAGIGNVFLADDGFGVAVAERLAGEELPEGVHVEDFGIRGMDLVFALGEGYDAALLIDAARRGEPAGTISVIEPETSGDEVELDTHGMDPARVLRLAAEVGPVPERVLVIACEPERVISGDDVDQEFVAELSPTLAAAVGTAADLARSMLDEWCSGRQGEAAQSTRGGA